jgi:hypothetical protein
MTIEGMVPATPAADEILSKLFGAILRREETDAFC